MQLQQIVSGGISPASSLVSFRVQSASRMLAPALFPSPTAQLLQFGRSMQGRAGRAPRDIPCSIRAHQRFYIPSTVASVGIRLPVALHAGCTWVSIIAACCATCPCGWCAPLPLYMKVKRHADKPSATNFPLNGPMKAAQNGRAILNYCRGHDYFLQPAASKYRHLPPEPVIASHPSRPEPCVH